MKLNAFLFFLLCSQSISWAQASRPGRNLNISGGTSGKNDPSEVTYRLEPIAGLETVYRNTPTPHTSTRSIYGARLVAGATWLSAEAEYTKGQDTENYSNTPESIINKDDKYKLGIRSTKNIGSIFFATLRLGGQATEHTSETTALGVKTIQKDPITYAPYAGVMLGIHLGSKINLAAGSTMVFKDNKDFSKNDVQNTLSISLGI